MTAPEPRAHDSRAPTCRPRDDSGSATVLAVGVIVAVLTVTVGGLAVTGALWAAHEARSSADLAALAAAGDFQQHADPVRACAAARRIARAQRARVLQCAVDTGGVATVTTAVPIPHGPIGIAPDTARGRARAGPR